MKNITVSSKAHEYQIFIGKDLLKTFHTLLPRSYSNILIITDSNVAPLYLQEVQGQFSRSNVNSFVIEAGESSKNIETYYHIQTKAIECGLDRDSLIVALGGGVVGDLAGFVAATYMRGIDYIQVPTTILAHDSSVGGKVAINHERGKNMIGQFYPPKMVVYDVKTLQTLPFREIRSGYAEIMKEALIANLDVFHTVANLSLSQLTEDELVTHLELGITIKANIVEMDEREQGIRMYLNLGHTLGHALERELGYGEWTHGEAVAVGLLFTAFISEDLFKKEICLHILLDFLKRNDYPLHVPIQNTKKLVGHMKSDKKSRNKKVRMVLLKEIGQPVIHELDDNILEQYVQRFFQFLINEGR